MWSDSGLSIDEIELVLRCGGYNPDPFLPLSREGLLHGALCHADGTDRQANGERAGAWISDQLDSATPEGVIEPARRMIAETDLRRAGEGRFRKVEGEHVPGELIAEAATMDKNAPVVSCAPLMSAVEELGGSPARERAAVPTPRAVQPGATEVAAVKGIGGGSG